MTYKTEAEITGNSEFLSVKIRRPSLRYLNEFTKLKCSPDLLSHKLFPNAKEITESFGAYNALRMNQADFPLNDKKINCIVVGDGHKPRTGALIAFRTAWTVTSIDPLIYNKTMQCGEINSVEGIDRLTVMKLRIEDVPNQLMEFSGKVIIVCVHSHAKLSECCKKFPDREKYIVNIPCCYPSDLNIKPDIEYTDWGIHSEKRQVEIYKKIDNTDMEIL